MISYIPKKTMKLMNKRFVCLAATPSETLYELFCVEGAKHENNEKAVSKLFYFETIVCHHFLLKKFIN